MRLSTKGREGAIVDNLVFSISQLFFNFIIVYDVCCGVFPIAYFLCIASLLEFAIAYLDIKFCLMSSCIELSDYILSPLSSI